jgi:hypothetical protein
LLQNCENNRLKKYEIYNFREIWKGGFDWVAGVCCMGFYGGNGKINRCDLAIIYKYNGSGDKFGTVHPGAAHNKTERGLETVWGINCVGEHPHKNKFLPPNKN